MTALRIIRDNFEIVFERMGGEMKVFNEKTHEYEVCKEFKQVQTVINELYLSKKKSPIVKYSYASRVDYGRRFSKDPSLQGVCKKIRHAIAKDIYIDLDFKNAHPNIQERKCREMGFIHEPLFQYNANRNQTLQSYVGKEMRKWEWTDKNNKKGHHINYIATTDDVKEAILTLVNGGSNRFIDCEFANSFEKRQQEFMKEFANYRKYPDHNKYVQRAKNKEYNKEGTTINYYFCDMEDRLLQHVEQILQEKGIRYGTLCFDGLQIYKDSAPEDINGLIAEIEASLLQTFNYAFKLSIKPMDDGVDISGLSIKEDIKTTDVDYALYILEALKNDLKYHSKLSQLYKFDEKQCLWKPIKIESLTAFIPEILTPYINTSPDPKVIETEIPLILSSSKQKSILYQIKNRVEMMEDDQFITENFDVKKGLFPLKDNQTIDMRTCEVRKRLREDYFTRTTDRIFKPNYKKAEVEAYYKSLLHNAETNEAPSEAYVQNFVQLMAYSMTGENNLKKFINLIGNGDNGKSVFIELHQEIMKGFATQGNKRTFIAQKSSSNHDAEAMGLINQRFVSLLELNKKDSFNEELIKSISGGDKFKVRGCGAKETVDVLFTCVLWIGTNELAKFENQQFKNRLLCIDFANKFQKNPAYVEELKTMYDDFFTHLCLSAKRFYENGRSIEFCPEIENYTEKMRNSQNSFLIFVSTQEVYEVVDKERRGDIYRDEIKEHYFQFCRDNDLPRMPHFYKMFEAHYNVKVSQVGTGNEKMRVYDGIVKL